MLRGRRTLKRSRRSLSRRGQATVLVLILILSVGAWLILASVLPGGEAQRHSGAAIHDLTTGSAAANRRLAPRELFEKLPVGIAQYRDWRESHGDSPVQGLIYHDYGPYRVEYSFDPDLTWSVMRLLERSRVRRGHVIALDPRTGKILTYLATDPEEFSPSRSYPAASLVKIITMAAALGQDPESLSRPCIYQGNRYRLSRSSVRTPRHGEKVSLENALASSNNKCFAQLAVETLGSEALISALKRFGWTRSPAPGHERGTVDAGDDEYDLGRLGCGLAGSRITPLHAAQLASILSSGKRIEPWWVERVIDRAGFELAIPEPPEASQVLSLEFAAELRQMLVRTTTRGTARSAFRDKRGRPKLGEIKVAAKTGNLTGSRPSGRYEWFLGVAPADDPRVAVVVLQLQDNLWWKKSSELGADVLAKIFCERGRCLADNADRFTGGISGSAVPVSIAKTRGLP